MPEKVTLERAREDAREGKSPSTQAGEFVREEMHHIREGKHGAASPQQAIAIGLSKARRAGVKLAAPQPGKTSARTRTQAQRDLRKGQSSRRRKPSARRSRAVSGALKKKGRSAASHKSLSQQARRAASRRGPTSRHRAAQKAARTRAAHRRAA
ncbi:MAG TPA: DNA-binding protein [Candidatus Angelobacter sp.]